MTTMTKRNEQAAALSLRAGNAGCAIAVDTRTKIVQARKGKGSYSRKAMRRGDY
jgi:stalled ribosome alternative rescue factor ArfA